MTYIEIGSGESGPLCPYSRSGIMADEHVVFHREAVRLSDLIWEEYADRRDSDGEMSAEDEKEESQRICDSYAENLGVRVGSQWDIDRMFLYHETIVPSVLGRGYKHGRYISAWWFQCQGCGFILPAQEGNING